MSLIIKKNTTFKILRTGSGAPSGISVASTNTINVVDTFGYNGTIALLKQNSTRYSASVGFAYGGIYCQAYENTEDVNIYSIAITREAGNWIYRYYGIHNCEETYTYDYDLATVQEVTSGIIPTTGWSPSLTITAA